MVLLVEFQGHGGALHRGRHANSSHVMPGAKFLPNGNVCCSTVGFITSSPSVGAHRGQKTPPSHVCTLTKEFTASESLSPPNGTRKVQALGNV